MGANSFDAADSEDDFEEEHDSSVQDTVVESVLFSSKVSIAPLTMKRIVRSDNGLQNRTAFAGRLASTNASTAATICPLYPRGKRCMDFVCAAIGLTLAAPVILIAADVIKLTSKGPFF